VTATAAPEAAGAAAQRSPYVGLTPYSEADAAYFFGRERDTRLIAANLRGSRLTLLYGASGVGKSSALMAGVMPSLRARARRIESRDRRMPWSIAMVREWRGDPLTTLTEAIRSSIADVVRDASLEPWEPGTPLVDALRAWTSPIRAGLVILDQFEEYFLYNPDDHGPGTFARELAQIVGDHELRVHVLMSLREDALSLLDRFKATIPGLFSNYLRIDYLDREAARRAIEGPIEEHNRQLGDGESPVVVEEALVDAVLDEVQTGNLALGDAATPAVTAGELGSGDRIETPFLQLVMQRLWSATAGNGQPLISLQALRDLGGAERIVSTHLHEALAALSSEQQRIAAELFAFLVTPSKTKIAQAPSDLAFWTRHQEGEVEEVVRELCRGERRILRAVPPPLGDPAGVERYEIFHDVLAAPITEWRLAQEQLREKDALAARLEDERRERKLAEGRRRRAVAAAVGALVLAAAVIIVAIVALHASSTARDQRASARAVALASAAGLQQDSDPELGVSLAAKALETKETPVTVQALRAALAGSPLRAVLRGTRSAPCPACRMTGPALAPGSEPPSAIAISRTGLVAGWAANDIVIWNPVTGSARRIHTAVADSGSKALSFSPDGRSVLAYGNFSRGELSHAIARVIPVARGAPRTLRVSSLLLGVAFSPDGREIVGAVPGALVRWDANTLERKGILRLRPSPPGVVLLSPEGVTFGGPGGRILAALSHRGVDLWAWPPHGGRRHIADNALSNALVSPNGRFIAADTGDRQVTVWSTSGRPLLTRSGALRGFSADSQRLLLVADDDADARLVAIRPPHARRTLSGHLDSILATAFSPIGGTVATASADSTVRLWDVPTGRASGVLRGHSGDVTGLAFSADGRFLATLGSDQTLRLWQVAVGRTFRDATKTVLDARFSPDGTRIVTGGEDGVVRVYDRGGRLRRTLLRVHGSIGSVAFSPDGERVVTAAGLNNDVGLLDVRDAATGRPIAASPVQFATAASPMPDGHRILAANIFGTVTVWRVRRRHLGRVKVIHVQQPRDADESVYANSIRVSRDGRWIALGATDGTVQLYSGRDYRRVFVRRAGLGATATVYAASFNPAGTQLVTAGTGQPGRIWSVPGGRRLRTIGAGTGVVFGAEFSPDGRQIVTGGVDGATRIWDAASGRLVVALRHHAAAVDAVAFSPDGRLILSAGDDRTARVYPCDVCGSVDALRRLARTRLTLRLTDDEVRRYAEGGS
jgi:WD40 repeat protein